MKGLSYFSQRKAKIVIAAPGAAALIVAIIFGLSYYQNPAGSKTATSNQNHNDQFTVTRCNDVSPASSILETNGFATIKAMTTGQPMPSIPTTGNEPGIYEFVLKPNSKAIVTMAYDFCPGIGKSMIDTSSNKTTSAELETFFDSFNSTNKGVYKLNVQAFSKSDDTTNDALGSLTKNNNILPTSFIPQANGTGVKIYPSNITKISDQSIKVTYVVIAESSASKATYVITNFYRTCPGEILTIGDEPNDLSQKWAEGPFYGCVG